jgi:hypothetical protein
MASPPGCWVLKVQAHAGGRGLLLARWDDASGGLGFQGEIGWVWVVWGDAAAFDPSRASGHGKLRDAGWGGGEERVPAPPRGRQGCLHHQDGRQGCGRALPGWQRVGPSPRTSGQAPPGRYGRSGDRPTKTARPLVPRGRLRRAATVDQEIDPPRWPVIAGLLRSRRRGAQTQAGLFVLPLLQSRSLRVPM